MTPEIRQILVELALAVISAIGVALLAALRMGVARLSELTAAKLSDSEQAKLDKALADAVAYAEEWARGAMKLGGVATGPAKLDEALQAARMFAGRAAQGYTDAQLAKLLEAQLARSRASLVPPATVLGTAVSLDGIAPPESLPPLRHPFG